VSLAVAIAVAWPHPVAAQPAPGSLSPPVVPACISSPFGPRNLPGPHAAKFHNGIDFPAPPGAWVTAVAAGSVLAIGRRAEYGLVIDLSHRDGHGGQFVTRYAHLGTASAKLARGLRSVAAGERIGRIGRTGITYGTHLHFELHLAGHPVDPEPYFGVPRCAGGGGR
jgi:murein DD-endopeptidase MepM/ murein hydrolase activator NlpD